MKKNNFIIKPIKLQDIPPSIILEGKEGRLIFRDKIDAHYFGGFIGDQLVSFTCLVIHKNGNAAIKSNFTLEKYRGRGYFTELNKYTLNYAREQGVRAITLNCLEDSVKIHLKAGARLWKKTKTIYWLIYDKEKIYG